MMQSSSSLKLLNLDHYLAAESPKGDILALKPRSLLRWLRDLLLAWRMETKPLVSIHANNVSLTTTEQQPVRP
jgi:hypothetical protein